MRGSSLAPNDLYIVHNNIYIYVEDRPPAEQKGRGFAADPLATFSDTFGVILGGPHGGERIDPSEKGGGSVGEEGTSRLLVARNVRGLQP